MNCKQYFRHAKKNTGKFFWTYITIMYLTSIFEIWESQNSIKRWLAEYFDNTGIHKSINHLCVCFRLYDFFSHYFGFITLLTIVLTLCYQSSLIFISTVDSHIIGHGWLNKFQENLSSFKRNGSEKFINKLKIDIF